MKKHIAFVGTGMMGSGMALRLLAAGHPLTVYARRNRASVDRLCAQGATEAPELATLARDAEVVVLCLADSIAVREVVAGLVPCLRAGQLIIDATTSDPGVTRALAAELAPRAVRFVDAPVTGGPPQAEAGALASMVGCAEADFADVRQVVACYSAVVQRMGGIGAGHTAKLLNNFVTQGTVALLAEAYTRARDAGIDWAALHAVMSVGAARSGTLEKLVRPALAGDFDGARFSIRNSAKDLGYFCAFAAQSGRGRSVLGETIRQRLAAAVDAGLGDRFVSRLLDPELDR